jgi:ketosteroid isomerase-like protein
VPLGTKSGALQGKQRFRYGREVSSDFGLDAALERYHSAAAEFIKGNVEPYQAVFSQTEDVTLANPFGPPVRGWQDASDTMERACALWAEGEIVAFDLIGSYVTPELAYIMEIERYRAKIGGSDELTPVELRVTSILRPEDGTWKVLHRHADPITTARQPSSVVSD